MLIQKAILCVEYIQSDLHVGMIGYDTAGLNMYSQGMFPFIIWHLAFLDRLLLQQTFNEGMKGVSSFVRNWHTSYMHTSKKVVPAVPGIRRQF